MIYENGYRKDIFKDKEGKTRTLLDELDFLTLCEYLYIEAGFLCENIAVEQVGLLFCQTA
jgi:hypothetical protein